MKETKGFIKRDTLSVEDIQQIIRNEWNWKKECVADRAMDKDTAINQAYGYGQGIIALLTEDGYNKVFSDSFRAEWEQWRSDVLSM